MNESYSEDIVEILDKTLRVIFIGLERQAVDWVCDHPLEPEMIWLRDYNDLMSIDDWLSEWDSLQAR